MSARFGGRVRKPSLSRLIRGSSGKGKPRLVSFSAGITSSRALPTSSAGYWSPSLVLFHILDKRLRSGDFLRGRIFCPPSAVITVSQPLIGFAGFLPARLWPWGLRSVSFARREPKADPIAFLTLCRRGVRLRQARSSAHGPRRSVLHAVARRCSRCPSRTLTILDTPGSCMVTP